MTILRRSGPKQLELGHTSLAGTAARQAGGIMSGTFDTGKRSSGVSGYGSPVLANAAAMSPRGANSIRAGSVPDKYASFITSRRK